MSKTSLYRQKSMARIQSPEQLDDYLKVTNPGVWAVLAAVVLLLAGLLIWGSTAHITSFVQGVAVVDKGEMTITFEDEQAAKNVADGMTVMVGKATSQIQSVGVTTDGRIFALADTILADGVYEARVAYGQLQVLKLLLN